MDEKRYSALYGVMVRRPVTGRLILGLIVLTLGVLWTLDNLGLIRSESILRWWPTVVIAIGAAKLVGFGTRRHLVWGVTFTIAGFWLLAGQLEWIHAGLFDLWPLLLIALGIQLLMRSRQTTVDGVASDDPSARLSALAIWSGFIRKVSSQEFRGGDVTAVMGGVRIDMRQAKPVAGGAVLDLFVWWGGAELTIPEHWRVVNEATVLMGGVEDKAKSPPPDAHDTLILRGLVVMGGVEIKN